MRLLLALLASGASAIVVAACVGDEPAASGGNGSDASVTTDAQSAGDGSPSGDAACVPSCGSACVDLNGDGKNCGVCGHDCLGGKCASGVCQALAVFTGKAPDASVAGVGAIAVESSRIYWVTPAPAFPGDLSSQTSTLYRCDVGGDCTVPTPYWEEDHEIDGLTTTASAPGKLFYADAFSGAAQRIGADGVDGGASIGPCAGNGSPCTLFSAIADGPVAVDGTSVFMGSSTNHGMNGSGVFAGTTTSVGSSPGALNAAIAGNPACMALAADTSKGFVYAAMSNGTIYIYPSTGTGNTVINTISGQTTVGQMLIANNELFWTNPSAGHVYTVARCVGTSCGNGAPPPTPQVFASAPGSRAMTADAKNIYWSAGGQILSCALNGCADGGPAVLASDTATVRAITNDATSIYWGDDLGSIWMVAK